LRIIPQKYEIRLRGGVALSAEKVTKTTFLLNKLSLLLFEFNFVTKSEHPELVKVLKLDLQHISLWLVQHRENLDM
jgi:hypothetical protein